MSRNTKVNANRDTKRSAGSEGNYKRAGISMQRMPDNTSIQTWATKSAITGRTSGDIIIRVSSSEAVSASKSRKTG